MRKCYSWASWGSPSQSTEIEWKFISHPSVSFIIVSGCPRDRRQLASPPCWYFFQHLLLCASANVGYLPCGSLMCGSVSWPKFGLLFLMNLSCWLIIYQIFISMISLQIFFTKPLGHSLVCFSLGFAFCVVLCYRRHTRIVTLLQNLYFFWQLIFISLDKKYMSIEVK